MSLVLSFSKPKGIIAQTFNSNGRRPLPILLKVPINKEDKMTVTLAVNTPLEKKIESMEAEIPMEDFCHLVEYVLSNTVLDNRDPRLELVKKIKTMHVIRSLYPPGKRLALFEEINHVSIPAERKERG